MLLIDKSGLTQNCEIITKFDQNIQIKLNLDDWIQKQIFYFGRYEIEKKETLFWQKMIKHNGIILDIGANIGYYSLMAAVRIGSSGKIFSFEPVTNTYRKLLFNISLNGFKNIYPQKVAVSNSMGEIELFVADEKNTGSSSIALHVSFSGVKERVNTITIDNFLNEKNEISEVDLVKIDVEGCEPMVIEGMKETMKRFRPIILIEILDERLKTIGSSKEFLYELFYENNYEAFEIQDSDTIAKIMSPKEGGLVMFKHLQTAMPRHLNLK
jgi:FkbM family methyltransferase